MFSTYTAIAALLCLSYPTIVVANPQACNQNACLREVVQGHKSAGHGGCKAFFGTTVVPQSSTTTTVTRTVTSSTAEVASETLQTTTSTTSTTTTTSTETDTQGVTTTSLPPSPTGQQGQRLLQRSKAPAITYSSTTVPAYASKVCSNTVVYSSACSCVGAAHHTTTLPLHVKTKTITKHHTTVQTISQTTTDATSISTAVSVASVTSATTTTIPSVVVGGQCTDVATAFDPETVYQNYYAGQGYEETPNNLGNINENYPPQTTDFPNIGQNDACNAIQSCANFAVQLPDEYYSFDIHYLSSSATWECVAYIGENFDPSYFNVANPDVTQGYGYSYAD